MNVRNALITGAGTGIGRAIALELAEAGYNVALHCNSSTAGAESAAAEIEALGLRSAVLKADISEVSEIKRMFWEFSERFETLDLFVNNAGLTLTAPLLEMTEEDFDRMYRVDFRGAYFAIQSAGRIMSEQGSGNIVVIASNHAYTQFARSSAYGSMKTALVKLARHAALELAKYHIRVNAIAPGWTDTGSSRLDEKESTFYKIPLKRWCLPDEIGKTVVFLASPAASSVTGACLVMDGGAMLLSDKEEKYGF